MLLCQEVAKAPKTMVKFKSSKNGDVAGIGYTEDGEELVLLDLMSLLRREGFLVMA